MAENRSLAVRPCRDGTADTAAFARAYRERWIPRLAGRYPVPAGAAGVHVCVVAKNVQAIGFYAHLGFELAEVDEPGGVVYLGRRL